MEDETFDFDDSSEFDLDASELSRIDKFIEDSAHGKAKPILPPSRTIQTTLDGRLLSQQPVASSSKPRSQLQRTASTATLQTGHAIPKTKAWDHTAYAKTGLKHKGKGKQRAADGEEEEWGDEEEVEFEQFPAPFVSGKSSSSTIESY